MRVGRARAPTYQIVDTKLAEHLLLDKAKAFFLSL